MSGCTAPRRRIVAALAVAFALVGLQLRQFLDSAMAIPGASVVFEVPAGSAFSSISRNLADEGEIQHPDWFRWYARLTNRAGAVQAGEYQIEAGTTPRNIEELLDVDFVMKGGKVFKQ